MSEESPTVLLLGAGASAASEHHLPTMSGFFTEEVLAEEAYPHLSTFLKSYFGPDVQLCGLNLEEIMTHLYGIERGLLPVLPDRNLRLLLARDELDKYVYKRLVKEPLERTGKPRLEPLLHTTHSEFRCSLHEAVMDRLDWSAMRDSIISLNYDLVADGTLIHLCRKGHALPNSNVDDVLRCSEALTGAAMYWELSPVSLARGDFQKSRYLKLHGSVHWLCCPDPTCANHRVFDKVSCVEANSAVSDRAICNTCGRNLRRAMIPPSLGKTPDEFPRMNVLWSLAFCKLRDAARWIIWGVSLAPSDFRLTGLLREAAQEAREVLTRSPECVVINPCWQALERVETITRTKATWFKSAEDWLENRLAARE